MENYLIMFTCGTMPEIAKYCKESTWAEAVQFAKNPVNWPIEYADNYSEMEVWVSTTANPDDVLKRFEYSEL